MLHAFWNDVELAFGKVDRIFRLRVSCVCTAGSSWTLETVGPSGQKEPGGRWTDSVWVDGDVLYRHVVRFTPEGIKDLERRHVVDRRTLVPHRMQQHFGPELGGVIQMEFDGTNFAAVQIPSWGTEVAQISGELSETPYGLSLYAILLVGFPLSDGFAASFPYVGPGGRIAHEVMRVRGLETVRDASGRE